MRGFTLRRMACRYSLLAQAPARSVFMAERVVHCPFLNRADARCANHFSVDRLGYAFDFCFGSYKNCPTYLEMLVERRVRQANDGEMLNDPDAAHDQAGRLTLHLPVIRTTRYDKSLT
jgi:hypothetical protein